VKSGFDKSPESLAEILFGGEFPLLKNSQWEALAKPDFSSSFLIDFLGGDLGGGAEGWMVAFLSDSYGPLNSKSSNENIKNPLTKLFKIL
jgi:hypothetical protein